MNRPRLSKRIRLIVRWGLPCVIGSAALGLFATLWSARVDPAAARPDGTIAGLTDTLKREVPADLVRLSFADVTQESGLQFHHFPAERRSLLPEDMGSGLAWGDLDDDGDPDLFLVNFRGSLLTPWKDATQGGRCKLFRNDGGGRFTDISHAAGLDLAIYGMAAAWGDYDNDQDLDLFVTAYGQSFLFRNDGHGTFTDVTRAAGVNNTRFGSGCAWGDYDNDGFIDLYVCNYVDFRLRDQDRAGGDQRPGTVEPYTVNPSSYAPVPKALYHNNGDGTFTDLAQNAGVADPFGRSLAAVWFDFNNDHLIDLYVANDISANAVFLNRGDGTFADVGAESLAADYRGAMGLAVGDYDRDGDFDLFVTHWIAQGNGFFVNQLVELASVDGRTTTGKTTHCPVFMDIADMVGLGQISLKTVGWATSFVDLDNDGNMDLWVVNGHTHQKADQPSQLVPQRPFLFQHQPSGGFFEVGAHACPRLAEPIVGRGGADADFDGDGRVDLAIQVHGGTPILLRNTTAHPGHWVRIRLRQNGGNTRALGALVTVKAGELVERAQVGADGAYLSQRPADLHFGLGGASVADEVVIRWPDGTEDHHPNLAVDRVVEFRHRMTAKVRPTPAGRK
jgi:hypothetical protein